MNTIGELANIVELLQAEVDELKRQNEIMAEAIKDFLDCSGGIDPNDERLGWLREALAKCGKAKS